MSGNYRVDKCPICQVERKVYKKTGICPSCRTKQAYTDDPTLKDRISKSTKEAMSKPEVRKRFLEKVQSKEWKKKASESAIQQWDEHRVKMIDANRKSWENPKRRERHLESLSRPEVREKISDGVKRFVQRPEEKKRRSKTVKQLWENPEYIEKQMKTKYDRQEGEIWCPNYNIKAAYFFKLFDEYLLNSGSGKYALNPKEERCGKYFLDYINHDFKLIIEWDEKHHKKPSRIDKDQKRQSYIQSQFPEYKIFRIDQDTMGHMFFLRLFEQAKRDRHYLVSKEVSNF